MTPEVATRLGEITVDPKTVVLQKPVDASAMGAPKPAGAIATGTWSYAVMLKMGEQSMTLATTTELKREGDDVVAVDRIKTPMGDAVDTVVLDPATLTARPARSSRGRSPSASSSRAARPKGR